jgi:hypothetical protein
MVLSAADEDPVTRAVRLLISDRTKASVACSQCGNGALPLCKEGRLGNWASWERNSNVSAMFIRADCAQISLHAEEIVALVVSHGAVVLSAQQVITAGLEHDMHSGGFERPLISLSTHLCLNCASPGRSARLLMTAKSFVETEEQYMDTKLRELALDDARVRIHCACGESINSGTLLPPPRKKAQDPLDTLTARKVPTPKAYALGLLPDKTCLDARNVDKHGQLLYFSRNTGKKTEVGILVWVVDQRLPVTITQDVTELFEPRQAQYDLTALNCKCHTHNTTFPTACGLCANPINKPQDATTTEFISGPVHCNCAQKCIGCGTPVARLGPRPEEAMDAEMRISLPALCYRCASGDTATKVVTEPTRAVLEEPKPKEKPGKASEEMLRETALAKLKRKAGPAGGGGKYKERWIGDQTEGLWPGDQGIYRLKDGTLALKTNKDGVISKSPVCGEMFTEPDGSHSIYEWNVRVMHRKAGVED